KLLEPPQIEEPQALSLLHSPGYVMPRGHLGEVQQRAGDGRHRDSVLDRDVLRIEAAHEVQVDPRSPAPAAPRNRHVDALASRGPDPPQIRGASVADRRARPAG